MRRKNRSRDKRQKHWYEFLPWIVLVFSLPISYYIWRGERAAEFNLHQNKFEYELNEASNQFANQISLYEQSLYAVKGFFDASEFVSEEEFDAFGKKVFQANFLSGVNQIGFAKFVNPMQANTYLSIESKFHPTMAQLDAQSLHAPLIYSISPKPTNDRHQLFDVFENKAMRKGMEDAAQYNQVTIIDNAEIGQDKTANCKCVAIVLPVYEAVKKMIGVNSEAPNNEIYGWVFLHLNLNSVVKNLLGVNSSGIGFSLYQGEHHDTNKLVYDSTENISKVKKHAATFTATQHINIHGQIWRMEARSLPQFEKRINYKHSTMIGFLGLILSIAFASLLYSVIGRMRSLDSLKHIHERLRFSDDRWRFALEGAGDGIWDWDIKNQYVVYSKNWKQMLGYDDSEISTTMDEWKNRVHSEDYASVMKKLDSTLQGNGNYSVECRLKCKDGSWKWVLARGMVVKRNEKGEPLRMVGTNTDISQLKESEEMIWQHANFDTLTGLPNRRMLNANLEKELQKVNRTRKKIALLFLDLDDFKEVNDTLGHDYGDELLKMAAKRLNEVVYSHDVVARFGGDEFVILISDLESSKINDLDIVANKVLSVLAAPFELDNQNVFISSSIGLAIYPDDADTLEGLLKCVDQAMYASKNRGGNCFTYFTATMQKDAINRLHLSNDLRLALQKKQFFLEYQPIISLSTNQIFKSEALLRWKHPERGLVSPAEFIPIAENTRLINEIGAWVFEEAVKQCSIWRQNIDDAFQITVNKSPIQFYDNENKHQSWLSTVIAHKQLNNAIVVEITEGLLLDVSGPVADRLKAYRDNWVQIALDDFGTGYSSLAYLQKFDIDYLKIDQSFVANLESSHESRVLCRAIIAMAHSLDIKVIAEGIETLEQRDILIDADCDFGQGYYFSKSLPPLEFEAYVKKTKPQD